MNLSPFGKTKDIVLVLDGEFDHETGPKVELIVDIPAGLKATFPNGATNRNITALIDTGAEISMLHQSIVTEMGLKTHSYCRVRGVTSPTEPDIIHLCLMYRVELQFTDGQSRIKHPCTVAAASLEGHGVDAIIGRDILKYCILSYDGQGGRDLPGRYRLTVRTR